jgi:hypothetical protein
MVGTDLGFLAYWTITALHVLPAEWLYKDYHDPILQAWNWSFVPIDLLVSGTGLLALVLARRGAPQADGMALISLTLTSSSGLMAVAFWTLRADFDPAWWLPNLFLLLYPLPFLARQLRQGATSSAT